MCLKVWRTIFDSVQAKLAEGYYNSGKKKTSQASKRLLTLLRKRSHLGTKAPSPEKKRAVSDDQEGCEQISQQTSPD